MHYTLHIAGIVLHVAYLLDNRTTEDPLQDITERDSSPAAEHIDDTLQEKQKQVRLQTEHKEHIQALKGPRNTGIQYFVLI